MTIGGSFFATRSMVAVLGALRARSRRSISPNAKFPLTPTKALRNQQKTSVFPLHEPHRQF
jgi:hypothetical protein